MIQEQKKDLVIAKVIKAGNSQAVRIPACYRLDVAEVTIEQCGEELVIRPRKPSFMSLLDEVSSSELDWDVSERDRDGDFVR